MDDNLCCGAERVHGTRHRIHQAASCLLKLPLNRKDGSQEDVRILCVHGPWLSVESFAGSFRKTLVPAGITFPTEFWDKAAYCLLFGILASGGSSFWNSALDTLRNVKTSMAPKT